jgi:type VI secretion system secreted protein VgrG
MATFYKSNEPRFYFTVGQKELMVHGFQLKESISKPFEATLKLVSDHPIDPNAMVGQFGLLTLESLQGSAAKRYVHGMVARFALGGIDGRFYLYEALFVPVLWLLTLEQDCRIFQDMSVPDIIRQVLDDTRILCEFRLTGQYAPRTYCVQYRETDLEFIHRLCAEQGLFYFFEHTKQECKLVFGDSAVNYQPIGGEARIVFNPGAGMAADKEAIIDFHLARQLHSGKYTLRDFNYERPALDLECALTERENKQLEIYDFPGDYTLQEDGGRLAQVRLQQACLFKEQAHGKSVVPRLAPGFTFTQEEHILKSLNQEYLLTQVSHEGSQPQVLGEKAGSDGSSYTNEFSAIPASVTFRPERQIHKPIIDGPQTAIVTGPADEEIYVDAMGRVKVQFHWDRLGKKNEKTSCWVRVSQLWAGAGWGAMFIPRIGQEVIVDFIEGDPDQPIITGRVYNGGQSLPYPLPAEKTKSTIKSNSSKGGGGCNELRFEDKKGSEELFIQAEKDMNTHVKNDQKNSVGRDRHLITHRDLLEKVERDCHVTIEGNGRRQVSGDENIKINGKSAAEVLGSLSFKVGGDVIESYQANHGESVGNGYKLSAMTTIIESASNITLKCGGSSIVLTPSGIFLEGSLLSMNSGAGPMGSVTVGGVVPPAAPLAATLVEAVTAGMSKADAAAHDAPTHKPSQDDAKKAAVEIELLDEDDKPIAGEAYRLILADGTTVAQGTLDDKGCARIEGIDPGTCKVTFPNLDQGAWKKK